MPYRITSQPASEPCTAAEAKLAARLTASGLDSLITSDYIPAARRLCELRTGRSLITQTIAYSGEDWPGDEIKLEHGPVSAITSITYRDTAGSTQTLSSAYYELRADGDYSSARVCLLPGYTWPALGDYENAFTVTYVAGYGAASDIPKELRSWVIAAVAEMLRTGNIDVPRDFAAGLLDRTSLVSF